MTLNTGDTAWYRDWKGKISSGTVIQPAGTTNHEHDIQIYWRDLARCQWIPTRSIWEQEPSWTSDHPCLCGCPFGDHGPSGCIPHQIHRYKPQP